MLFSAATCSDANIDATSVVSAAEATCGSPAIAEAARTSDADHESILDIHVPQIQVRGVSATKRSFGSFSIPALGLHGDAGYLKPPGAEIIGFPIEGRRAVPGLFPRNTPTARPSTPTLGSYPQERRLFPSRSAQGFVKNFWLELFTSEVLTPLRRSRHPCS